jgi:hypothetical protein
VICRLRKRGVFWSLYKSSTSDKRGANSTLSTFLLGALVLFLAMLLSISGLLLVQRRVPLELRQPNNSPVGIIYGALYVTFGVIIGFSAFLVLNKYTTSQTTVVNEASDVRALYFLAEQFPEAQRDQLQDLAISYARVVIEEEWPLMREGQLSLRATALNQEITKSVDSFQPSTSPEQTLYSQALQRAHELNQNRSTRSLYASKGLPPILWMVLGVLGVMIIIFTYFLGMESARLHILAVAALTAGLSFTVFTTMALDQPFGGDLRVTPNAFETVLSEMESSQPTNTLARSSGLELRGGLPPLFTSR